jgi:O-acetyl-ADP-ribose deacetylase
MKEWKKIMSMEPLIRIGKCEIFVLQGKEEGDILRSGAEVLVNSAGTFADMSGDGVSRAMLEAGGEEILTSLRAHRPLIPGDVVITSAGKLSAKNIYHAVVVEWGKKDPKHRVTQATIWRVMSRSLELAQLTNMSSIAFPSLGTGAGRAEKFETHSTMAAACLDSLQLNSSLRKIFFCFIWWDTANIFRSAFLQQQLIRQARGLLYDIPGEQEQLAADFHKIWPGILGIDTKIDVLIKLIQKLEEKPSAEVIYQFISTQGGAYIEGDVNTGGGDFVGQSSDSRRDR